MQIIIIITKLWMLPKWLSQKHLRRCIFYCRYLHVIIEQETNNWDRQAGKYV